MASFIFENIWQDHRKVPCEIKKGAGRQLVIHPEIEGGPCTVMNIYSGEDTNLENPLVKDIDRMRYFNSYHKYVQEGTGIYLRGFYTLYLNSETYDSIMSLPEFANLEYEEGITEEDFQTADSVKRIKSESEFHIICCKDLEDSLTK